MALTVFWDSKEWFGLPKNDLNVLRIEVRAASFWTGRDLFFSSFFHPWAFFRSLQRELYRKVIFISKKIISAITKAVAIGKPRVVGSIIRADFMPALLANQ